jgi:hypothetical protein
MRRFFGHLWIGTCLAVLLSAAALSLLHVTPAHAASNTITADFSVGVDNPLLKTKFNLFNTFKRTPTDFVRDAALLSELGAENMRVDFELGEPYGQDASAVGGTASALTYDYSLIDEESRLMLQHGVTPYWDYTYTPYPLQTVTSTCNVSGAYTCGYYQPPLTSWAQVAQAFAAHFKAANIPVATQEVWNEPDGGFYKGSLSDYEALYASTEAALRAGDADAVLGGPAIAGNTSFNSSFLSYLNSNSLPLNVDTFHTYGSGSWASLTNTIASQLSSYAGFGTTTMSLDEYASYPCCNYPVGGIQDHYAAAAQLLHDFDQMLNSPALTSVSWAQFQDECATGTAYCYDPSIGLVTYNGHRKATFNAFKIYSMMPVDRKQITIAGATQEVMASADAHRASLVALNQTGSDQSTTVTLKNVPFSTGTVTVYRIDSSHASYFDNGASETLVPTETYSNVNTANWTWTGTIPSNGTVYFQVDDGSGLSSLTPNPVAKVINVNHYYWSRTTSAYADFDPRTWTARQGMGNNQWADQEVGVTAEDLPPALTFTPTIQGTLVQNDQNSCACIRIDYMVNGAYTKGVLFHGPYNGGTDLYGSTRNSPMQFGTKRQADQVVGVSNLSNFQVNLAQYAPSGWSGRAQITYIFQNAGNNARWVVPVKGGPVGSWAFNEGSGTTTADSSGNGLTGTISGATWGAGVSGDALVFNGTSSNVSMGNKTALNTGTNSFSVSSWFKTTSTGVERIVSNGHYGWTNGYFLGAGHAGSGLVSSGLGAGGIEANSILFSTTSAFNDGNWHHALAVYDRQAGTAQLYIDGVARQVTVLSGTCGTSKGTYIDISACSSASGASSDPFSVGSYNGSHEFFNGCIDSVSVYDVALPASYVIQAS